MLKKTELGFIPREWNVDQFTNLVTIVRGASPRPIENYLTSKNDGINWIKIGDVSPNAKYITSTKEKITESGKDRSRKVFSGDFILSNSMSFGRPYILKINGCIHDGWLAIQNINKFYDADYLYYFMSSKIVKHQYKKMAAGSSVQNLNKDKVGQLKVLVLDKNEQKLIANNLSDIDNLIDYLEKLIEKKKLIKQGVMQELLTGKKRLPGFNKEWKQVELGSLGEIYNGLTGKTKNDFGWGNSKYVTFLNVLNNRKLNNKLFEKVNINEVQNFIKYGDLFFNTSSEIPEEVALCSAFMDKTNENIAVNSFCFGFRLYDLKRIFPLYIVDYFRSNDGRKKIIQIAQGSTRYNLSKEYFLKLLIPIPEYEEQKAISTIISDIDDEINFLEQDLEKYKNIKQGMMEQLLTGKFRVV